MKPPPITKAQALRLVEAFAYLLGQPPQTVFNIHFQGNHCMSGTQPQGTNIGTFTAPLGDHSVFFNAAVVAGTSDNTPPEVSLLNFAPGTVTVNPIDPTNTFYPVEVSGLPDGSTTVIQVSGDNVADCYLTVIILPKTMEEFSVDPTTVAFGA